MGARKKSSERKQHWERERAHPVLHPTNGSKAAAVRHPGQRRKDPLEVGVVAVVGKVKRLSQDPAVLR